MRRRRRRGSSRSRSRHENRSRRPARLAGGLTCTAHASTRASGCNVCLASFPTVQSTPPLRSKTSPVARGCVYARCIPLPLNCAIVGSLSIASGAGMSGFIAWDDEMSAATLQRTRLIKLLHVARRDLGMEEDTYRAVIASVSQGRTRSSKDLRLSEMDVVLEHMKQCGFTIKSATPQSRPLADDGQSRKIRALWLSLHQSGKVRDSSEAALASFIKRMASVEALQWLTAPQASRIIEYLKQWQNR